MYFHVKSTQAFLPLRTQALLAARPDILTDFDAARSSFLADLERDGCVLEQRPLKEVLPPSADRTLVTDDDVATVVEFPLAGCDRSDRYGVWRHSTVANSLFDRVGRQLFSTYGSFLQFDPAHFTGKRLVLPASTLFLGAAEMLSGPESMAFVPTRLISTSVEFHALLSRDEHPLCLPDGKEHAHGEDVPPFLAAMHDLYHILYHSSLSRDARMARVAIHDAFIKARPLLQDGGGRWADSMIGEMLDMDQVQALEIQHGRIIHWSEFLAPNAAFARAFHSELAETLRDNPLRDRILGELRVLWPQYFRLPFAPAAERGGT